MERVRWFYHPVFIFVLSLAALAISLFLYIYWYVGVSEGLKSLSLRYNLDPNQFFEAKTWVVILILSILVGIILAGVLTIFIYNLKTLHLYRLQNTFISNFTHELKTPVTSLKLFLETFAKHEISREDQLKYISFMLRDVDRLAGNISSILNLAGIESKVYRGEYTRVDLIGLVREFLVSNRHLFRKCDIQLENPSSKALEYPVIVPLFEMLLMNTLTNAIKYNVADRPRVEISFVQDRDAIQIRFRDNGIGMDREERTRIFKKFYQGRRHDERIPVGGSGIGLYLAQHIARLHHGRITAESEGIGKGSVFTLSLSRAAQKKDEP
jgi:two-component system, OmpR family, phosphate regulon sensor histidine kinase PhoR